MNLVDCYRLLDLQSTASLAEIKASYRRMALKYHPDVNPTDQEAKDKFIELTQAYELLLDAASNGDGVKVWQQPAAAEGQESKSTTVRVTRQPTAPQKELSLVEERLKWSSYRQLQQFLKEQKMASAIVLVEGLAHRFPEDIEVRQWQAITYQHQGRQLLNQKQLDKARIYLKKALKTDPHNRSLWTEVEKDFRRMERIF
jgi:curved DNA-binding protein CbpA